MSVGIYGISANAGLQVEPPLGRHFSVGVLGSRQFSPDFHGYQGDAIGQPGSVLGGQLNAGYAF